LENEKIKADAGDANAACGVAAIVGFLKDYDTMYEYANKSIDLSNGQNHEALDILGNCYKGGYGCEKDEKKAFELYLKASELGNDEAQWKLGVYYIRNDVVESDLDKAIYWLSKSAEEGNNMGHHYLNGAKMAKDMGIKIDIGQNQNEPYMVINFINGQQIEFDSNLEYFSLLSKDIKNVDIEPSNDNLYKVKELAVHGINFYYEKLDINNARLIYESVRHLSISPDSEDFMLVLMDWKLENSFSLIKRAVNELDSCDHSIKAVEYAERLYELNPDRNMAEYLIDQYRNTADTFSHFGDKENFKKYINLAKEKELNTGLSNTQHDEDPLITLLFCFVSEDYLTDTSDNLSEEQHKEDKLIKELIGKTKSNDARYKLMAWNQLRKLSLFPDESIARTVHGYIFEMGMEEGVDYLAIYSDYTVRYFNRRGAKIFYNGDKPVEQLDCEIKNVLSTCEEIVNTLSVWEGGRRNPPKNGMARVNFLTPSGMFFGEGPFETLAKDDFLNTLISQTCNITELITSCIRDNNQNEKND